MTSYEVYSLVISAAGFAGVAGTVAVLINQTKELASQTRHVGGSLQSGVYNTVSNQSFAIDQVFINNPELRPYFYENVDISNNDAQYNKAAAVAELLLDYYDSVLIQSEHFPQSFPVERWRAYMRDSFGQSPLLRRYLETVKGWYTQELFEIMTKGVAEFPA